MELLDRMYNHYCKQICKYRDFFPKNCPKGALEKTIFMLRVVHKNPMYREAHTSLPESFSQELRRVICEAACVRYEFLMEFNAPLDENCMVDVIESMKKLTDAITADLATDERFFADPFIRYYRIYIFSCDGLGNSS